MKYAADYTEALKYGRAPEQGIGTFIRAAHGQEVHHTNTHDAVLADYLEEHEDPRHLIVRRHLERTKQPVGSQGVGRDIYHRLGPEYQLEHYGTSHVITPDGAITFHRYHSPESGQRAVLTQWEAKHPDEDSHRIFEAVLSPAEVHHLRQNLHGGEHHTTSDQLPVPI